MQHITSNAPHLSDEVLSERLDERLATNTRHGVDEHLATCDACATRYADLRATRAVLQTLRKVSLPRDFRLDGATASSSPLTLVPARNTGLARLLSTAAVICGLIFLAVGLVSFTITTTPAGHEAAANSAAAAPQAPTTCVVSARCPSVNAGQDIAPTTTAAYGSAEQTPPVSPTARAGSSLGTAQASTQAPNTSSHNSTPSVIVLCVGILTTMAGAIGLWQGKRSNSSRAS